MNIVENRLTLFGIAAALSIQIFIFTPLELYLRNFDEMHISIGNTIELCMIPTLMLFLTIVLISGFGTLKFKKRLTVLMSILIILVWLQGNILLWDYGTLDGQPIDWTKNTWQGRVDISIWILILSFGLFFWSKFDKQIVRIAIAVFFILFIAMIYLLYENRYEILKTIAADQHDNSLEELYKFSSKNNILHIVLDGLQADVFHDLLNIPNIGAAYRSQFKGFIFYIETLGNFPYTRFAVPAFLSGKLYSNEIIQDDFVDATLRGKNILNLATKNGYEVDIGAGLPYLEKRYANANYKNIYGLNNISSPYEAVAQLIDLSLFRIAPHFIKPFIYNNQKWLLLPFFSGGDGMQFNYFKHKYFLNNLINNMTISREVSVYKYLHVMNTHNPMVVDVRCQYAGRILGMNRKTLTVQSKCTLDILVRLFEKMKELGIYDKTLIVMHGDHGGWVPNHRSGQPIFFPNGYQAPNWVASLASPMLSIKLPGASGKIQISPLLVSLSDLPDTISDIMSWKVDFGHKSIMKIKTGEMRERRFRFYGWRENEWMSDYPSLIQEYIIKGSHYSNKWEMGPSFQPPE